MPPERSTRRASAYAFDFSGQEHQAELAHYGVKRLAFERKLHGICLAPLDHALRPHRSRIVEHRLIQVCGHDGHILGQHGCHSARNDAGPGRDFEYPREASSGESMREVRCIGLEDQRNQIPIVEFRNRTGEDFVGIFPAHESHALVRNRRDKNQAAPAGTPKTTTCTASSVSTE